MHRLLVTLTSTLVAVLLYAECTPDIAGGDPGGSEITNGAVLSMAGSPAPGINVTAYPLAYIAGSSAENTVIKTFTNDTGGFALPIDSGRYNLFIADSVHGSGSLIRDIGSRQHLGTIKLDTLGIIEGTVTIDAPPEAPILIIYSKGTPLRVAIASADRIFRLDRVPPGTYTLSIAKTPAVGCTPGIDCLPGSPAVSPVELKNIIIPSGGKTMVNTMILADSIGTLP